MDIKKKLVIGAENIKGATKCVSWNGPFPLLSNYHEIYFYIPSLDTKSFSNIFNKSLSHFLDLREQLFEIMKSPIFSVVCITGPKITTQAVSNYDFLPFKLQRTEGNIETLEDVSFSNDSYLQKVKSSDGYFGHSVDSKYLNNKLSSTTSMRFNWRLFPVIRTLHRYSVAFTIQLVAEESVNQFNQARWKPIPNFGTNILFVPKIFSNPQDNLNILIANGERNDTTVRPNWFTQLKLPNEDTILSMIRTAQKQKDTAEKEILKQTLIIDEYSNLKDILSNKGLVLEKSIDFAFNFLGITLRKGIPAQEDRWLEDGADKIPMEIKGHTGSVKTEDIRQIIERTRLSKNTIGPTQGILIENPYCETEPSSRRPSFEKTGDKIIEKSESFNIALLDTITLFEFITEKLKKGSFDTNSFKKLLFTSIGVIKK